MSSRHERVCWDSDVIITILKGDDPHRTDEDLTALREALIAFDAGEIIVVVPTTIYSEVLDPLDDEDLGQRFEQLLRRSNLVVQDITQEVSRTAGQIRKDLRNRDLKLRTPDSQFIATAVLHDCDALHTFDDRLHKLSHDKAVHGLTIIKPQVEQTELRLGDGSGPI